MYTTIRNLLTGRREYTVWTLTLVEVGGAGRVLRLRASGERQARAIAGRQYPGCRVLSCEE